MFSHSLALNVIFKGSGKSGVIEQAVLVKLRKHLVLSCIFWDSVGSVLTCRASEVIVGGGSRGLRVGRRFLDLSSQFKQVIAGGGGRDIRVGRGFLDLSNLFPVGQVG